MLIHEIYPMRLRPGDQVALIAPASCPSPDQIALAHERAKHLGLSVAPSPTLTRHHYFAGNTASIVSHIHEAFANPEIKAIFTLRGGFGCMRLLPELDYKLIQENPKIVMGASDVTALLMAITAKTGLMTYHGPNLGSVMHPTTAQYCKRLLFDADTLTLSNHIDQPTSDIVASSQPHFVINSGQATGRLFGGNMSIFCHVFTSPYSLPALNDCILFFEDVAEPVYKVDRMLCQLDLHGVFSQIKGVVFGSFTQQRHALSQPYTMADLLHERFQQYDFPVFRQAMFGHQDKQYILPLGHVVKIDANQGQIALREPVVR